MVTEDQALAFLRDQLEREKGISPDRVTLEADLTNDLEADSLDLVEMVMKLEDEFKVTIPDDVAGQMKTVGDVVRFLTAAPVTK